MIKKNYTFNNERNIWRLLLTDLDQIVIEERDINKKEVFFSCIDYKTGTPFWKNKTFANEKFWIGIEGTSSNVLFLHLYEKPNIPNHKKIIAVELNSGDELWRNEDLVYYNSDRNNIYAFKQKFENKLFYKLNILTGEIEAELGNENEASYIISNIPEKDYSKYIFGVNIHELKEKNNVFEIISKHAPQNRYFDFIEYIEKDQYLIFNYYDKLKESKLTNRLVIHNMLENKTELIETINSSTPAPVPDSFFMYENLLFFVKDKQELVALEIY